MLNALFLKIFSCPAKKAFLPNLPNLDKTISVKVELENFLTFFLAFT